MTTAGKWGSLLSFKDDTILLSLFHGSESNHGPESPVFVKCCDDNYLDLNVLKTKLEMTSDTKIQRV